MRRRKKRSTRGGTEREARRGRHYTNGIANGAQERAPARGEAEEPSLSSFRPLARQTLPSPDAEVALFAALVQVYIYGLIPLPVVTDNASLRSFVRSLTRPIVLPACMQMHRHCRAGDYRGSRRTSRSPYLTRTMPCRA